jgi:hypothetical protein
MSDHAGKAKADVDQVDQEPKGLFWRSFLNLVAWATLTACSLLLTTTGAIGLGLILNYAGVTEISRLRIYVAWYAMASPLAILLAFRWFR